MTEKIISKKFTCDKCGKETGKVKKLPEDWTRHIMWFGTSSYKETHLCPECRKEEEKEDEN